MRSTQVTTWRKYTQAEKQAYHARQARQLKDWRVQIELNGQWHDVPFVPGSVRVVHHFADNFGHRVPTARVNGDVL